MIDLVNENNTENNKLPVHWLSKDARYKIIDIMLSTRSIRQLAEELGVSSTAIRKYISRKTHPSDETMYRVLKIMAPYEEERLITIIIDDIIEAVKRLYTSLEKEEYRKYLLIKLKEVLKEIGE